MNNDNKSFRLTRQARSFHVSDFTLRDLPLLALAFVLVTVFSLGLAWFLEFIPPNGRWVCLGLAVGFYLGIVFSSWLQRSAARIGDSVPPKPSTK